MPWESQVPQVQSSALRVSSTTSALTAQELQSCKRQAPQMHLVPKSFKIANVMLM